MDILTTRVLRYIGEQNEGKELVVTIFVPYEATHWRCGFTFDLLNHRKSADLFGYDFLQALLHCLEIVPAYFRLRPLPGQPYWQGRLDCGFPVRTKDKRTGSYQPPELPPPVHHPGRLEALATRSLACPDPQGATHALRLTVYKPLQTDEALWQCAISFGSEDDKGLPVRYGTGADFIESFLDALALARATYETMIPNGWHPSKSEDLLGCNDFPFKIGRAFHADMVGDLGPDAPDFNSSVLPNGT